jgi:hypothetical protein
LLFGFLEQDVATLAGDILKWLVKKLGEIDGDGCHFFDSKSACAVNGVGKLVSLV